MVPADLVAGRKRLWILLPALAAVMIVGAVVVRSILRARHLRAAAAVAARGISRNSYGGFRDADRALREFVGPRSSQRELVALRAYALAQLASRYADDQAAIDAELLIAPLERDLQSEGSSDLPAQFYAARAWLLLANGEPGSALLLLSGTPPGVSSPELSVVRARVLDDLDRQQAANAALREALARAPPSVEALWAAGDVAGRNKEEGKASQFYARALEQNPEHWPSLLALADLAIQRRGGVEPSRARDALRSAAPNLAAEASPGEQCGAMWRLSELDLGLGEVVGVTALLEQGEGIDDAPPTCRVELARLDARLGRRAQALALLKAAASEEDPQDAPLAYAEEVRDPKIELELASRPPVRDLSLIDRAHWDVRANAARLEADLGLGQAKAAQAAAQKLEGWETPQALAALGQMKAALGDAAGSARLFELAHRAAQKSRNAGDDLDRVGEQALALHLWNHAVSSCGEGVRRAAGNYRGLVCEARGLLELQRRPEAAALVQRALAIDARGEEALLIGAKLGEPPPTEPHP